MDPDVVAQLEEQLRELTDMLSRQTSAMNAQMDAMNKVAGSAKSASDSMRNNSQTSTTSTTKYAEAQEKATTQTGKSEIASKALAASFGTLSASVSSAIGVFGSLGSSLLSAEQGMAKYGKVADAAASGAEGLARSIPIVGDALGGLVGVVGKVAAQILTDGLKLVDTFVDMRDGLVQVGGALPVTGEQLIKLANNAGYYGERMQVLGKITQGLGTSLATLDTTAGRGATKFMELAAVTDETRRQYGRMGISQERLTEMQGMYVKSQEASGLAMQNQTKSTAQLRKESLAYVDNMTRLSSLTGKQAEQLQAEQDAAASVIQERLEILKENQQIKQLRAEGRGAEAADIERKQQDRAKFRQELTAAVGPEEATKIMKIIRSGVYDSTSAAYANLGVDIAKYGDIIRQGGADTAEAARGLVGELDTGRERMAGSLGAGTEFIPEEQLAALGFNNEAIGRQLNRAGKNYEEASDQAEKDIAARKTQGDDLADMVENIRSQERQFQAAYQEFLLDKVMKLSEILKDFDLFGMVTKNFSSIMTGLGVGLVAVTAASAALAVAAAVAAARLAGVGGGGIGAAGPAAAANAAKGGGFLSRAGGFAKGLLGKVALPVMAGMALYDAYQGYTADPNASFGDKLGNAGSSALNGLSFGLLGSSATDLASKSVPASQAAAANLARTGVLSPATAAGLGVDTESMEEMQNSLASRNREMSESLEEQQTASNKLLGTTGTLDETMLSTNKAMKIFRDLLVSLNSVLGGVDEEGNPTSASPGAMPGGMMGSGIQGGGETDKILATIKQMESGNNYQAQNPTSSASGAYQFIDSTWQSLTKKAGIGTEFKSAKEAPAAIQDKIAQMYLQEIMGKAGGDLSKIPTAWFTGNVQGKSSAVSQEQVQKYVQKWMGIYSGMPGGGMPGMPGMPGGNNVLANLGRFNQGLSTGAGMMGGGGQAAALALASQYLGMNETTDRQAIAAFLKAGGAGLDPKVEAWCAAFVNSALQQSGIKGSGSAVANSFQNWGKGVPVNQVMPGDVVLETRGKGSGQTGGHVGLGTGKYGGGKIGMLSGNSSNKVTDMMIPADGDVMVRRGTMPMAERGGILRGPDSGYTAMLHGTEMVVPLDNKFTRSMTGVKNQVVDKNSRIQQSLMQMVGAETNKAIKAINETNAPMQNMSTEISNSMRKVMEAHNSTMYELTYKLGEMIDAMNTSNDVTKKILKKASA